LNPDFGQDFMKKTIHIYILNTFLVLFAGLNQLSARLFPEKQLVFRHGPKVARDEKQFKEKNWINKPIYSGHVQKTLPPANILPAVICLHLRPTKACWSAVSNWIPYTKTG